MKYANKVRYNLKITEKDGQEFVTIPLEHYEALLDMRDEYSAMLTAAGKNLHGLPLLPEETRYKIRRLK